MDSAPPISTASCNALPRLERAAPPPPQPGEMTRAQLAKTASSADHAFRAMRGQPFFVESKFDGERIQLHKGVAKDGAPFVRYFSRNMHDNGPFDTGRSFCVFDSAVMDQARARAERRRPDAPRPLAEGNPPRRRNAGRGDRSRARPLALPSDMGAPPSPTPRPSSRSPTRSASWTGR